MTQQSKTKIFLDGRWSKPNEEDLSQMHRSEAQLWLCLRQLLLEPRLKHLYVIDEVRRTAFCRVCIQHQILARKSNIINITNKYAILNSCKVK